MKLCLACPLLLIACSADARESVGATSEMLGVNHCVSPSSVLECPVNSQPQICSGPFHQPPHCTPVIAPIIRSSSSTIWCCAI